MNGLSGVGRVRSFPTYELTNDSVIFFAWGKYAYRKIVAPITRGINSKYIGSSVVMNNSTDKYTENRTTAFRAAGTDISGVGTKMYQVS
jgi:hypothetical protein